MLERLRGGGIKYVFVSNSDNLGATLDLDLLAFFAASDSAFTMEVSTPCAAPQSGGAANWRCEL